MPHKELARLKEVQRFLTFEVERKKELNDIVKLAAEICQTPIALITILDEHTQYIKFQVGFDQEEMPKTDSFCQYAIDNYDVMEVADATVDKRFVDNPLVTGTPNIRFYAGAPMTTHDGHNLGSLCVIDHRPKLLDDVQRKMLEALSRQAIQILEFELAINALKEQFIKTRTSEIKLRSFFESATSCHLLIGTDLRILAFNKAVAQFITAEFAEKLKEGADIREYVHPSHLPAFLNNCQLALAGKTVKSEREIKYSDRSIYWYLTFEPAINQDSQVIGISINATDITERIKQEQTVLKQNESLRRIAFIQSHEIRRPVSSILGLMNLIKEEEYYHENKGELLMLDIAIKELDEKVQTMINYTHPGT